MRVMFSAIGTVLLFAALTGLVLLPVGTDTIRNQEIVARAIAVAIVGIGFLLVPISYDKT